MYVGNCERFSVGFDAEEWRVDFGNVNIIDDKFGFAEVNAGLDDCGLCAFADEVCCSVFCADTCSNAVGIVVSGYYSRAIIAFAIAFGAEFFVGDGFGEE